MTTAKTPLWFWIVGALLLLWNATGIFNFSSQIMMTEKMLLTLPIEQQELFAHFSWWVKAAFGMGVFGGTLGSIALLAKKLIAKNLFLISLVGILIQTSNNLYYSWGTATFNTVIVWLVILVSITFLALRLCRYSLNQGWAK